MTGIFLFGDDTRAYEAADLVPMIWTWANQAKRGDTLTIRCELEE